MMKETMFLPSKTECVNLGKTIRISQIQLRPTPNIDLTII